MLVGYKSFQIKQEGVIFMSSDHTLWLSWWADADWILRGVFSILIGLSILSWTVIVYKWRQISAAQECEQKRSEGISATASLSELAGQLSGDELSKHLYKELHDLTAPGREPLMDRATLEAKIGLWMRGRRVELENHLAVLATTGNTSPFIGLFGTVWGIMHALQALGGSQMLSLQMVAGPVAESLVSTAAGLFAAIPAVMAYNFFVRKLRTVTYLIDKSGNAVVDAMLSHRHDSHAELSNLGAARGV